MVIRVSKHFDYHVPLAHDIRKVVIIMERYFKLRSAQDDLKIALMTNNKRMIEKAVERLEALRKAYGLD